MIVVVPRPVHWRWVASLLVATLALSLAGCSPHAGSITGTVAVGGKPLTSGQISFVTAAGAVYTFNIEADGAYHADGVPTGEMTVLVFGPKPPAPSGAAQAAIAKKLGAGKHPAALAVHDGPTVSLKYGDAGTSDLRYAVTPGANIYDPPLK